MRRATPRTGSHASRCSSDAKSVLTARHFTPFLGLQESCPALTSLDASGVPVGGRALIAAMGTLKLRSLSLNGSTPSPVGDFDKTLRGVAEALAPTLESLSLRSCTRLASAVRIARGGVTGPSRQPPSRLDDQTAPNGDRA